MKGDSELLDPKAFSLPSTVIFGAESFIVRVLSWAEEVKRKDSLLNKTISSGAEKLFNLPSKISAPSALKLN